MDQSTVQHQRKFLFSLIGLGLVTLMVFAGFLLYSFKRSYQDLDLIVMKTEAERSLLYFDANTRSLEEKAADWSVWDDAYHFVRGENPDFVPANFNPAVIATMKLDYAAFVDAELKPLAQIERIDGNLLVTNNYPDFIKSAHALITKSAKQTFTSIVMYRGRPAIVVAQTITDSNATAPPKGRVIFIRSLTDSFLSGLKKGLIEELNFEEKPEELALEARINLRSDAYLDLSGPTAILNLGLVSAENEKLGSIVFKIKREVKAYGDKNITVVHYIYLIFLVIIFVIMGLFVKSLKIEDYLRDSLRALEQARHNESLIRALLDTIPGSLSWFDNQLKCLGVNKRLAKIYGVKESEMIGTVIGSTGLPDPAGIKGLLADFLKSTKQSYASEITTDSINPNDPPGIQYRLYITMEKFDQDTKVMMLAFDTSEMWRLEQAAQRDRQAAVHAGRLATLGEMAGGIAHEINNPLAVIQGIGRRILRKGRELGFESDLQGSVDQLQIMTERISRIIVGLKSFARDASEDPLRSVTVNSLIEQATLLCRERFVSRGIDLRLPEIDDSITVICRPIQLSQTIMSLLTNSFDAIELMTERWVKIEVKQLSETTEIAIVDSGPGLSPQVLAKIMEPFFTTKGLGKGTGLGLSVAMGVIKDLGGEFFYDSQSPNTRFVIRLPLEKA